MVEEKTERFGISLPGELLEKFDKRIEDQMYSNRSEAIRDLIRESLVEEKWEDMTDQEVVGTLTLVYNHDKRGISDKLTDLQHEDHANVISSMHVHLDKHNCMETLVLKGSAEKVKEVSNKLISTKGVKHGDLVKTTI